MPRVADATFEPRRATPGRQARARTERPREVVRPGFAPEPFVYDRVIAERLGLVAGTPIPNGLADLPWPERPRFEDIEPLLERRPQLVRILPRTEYTFDAQQDRTEDVPLAEGIEAHDFAAALLIVRLHTKPSWVSTTAQAQVLAFNESRAAEDPSTLFTRTAASATVTILNGDTAPNIYVAALSAPIAASLRVVLRWVQGSSPSTGGDRFALAVSLLLRP